MRHATCDYRPHIQRLCSRESDMRTLLWLSRLRTGRSGLCTNAAIIQIDWWASVSEAKPGIQPAYSVN